MIMTYLFSPRALYNIMDLERTRQTQTPQSGPVQVSDDDDALRGGQGGLNVNNGASGANKTNLLC